MLGPSSETQVQHSARLMPSRWPLQDKSSIPSQPTITIRTIWDPFRLMRHARVEDATALLGHLVSVTGDWELAQAERCRDYVLREWRREGEEILSLLEEIIKKHSQLSLPVASQNDKKQVISRVHQLSGAIISMQNLPDRFM